MPKKKKVTPKSDFFTNIYILARVNTIKFNSYSLYCTQFEIVGMCASAGYNKDIVGLDFKGIKDARCLINGKNVYARIFIKKVS